MLGDTWDLCVPSRQAAGLLAGVAVAATVVVGGTVLLRRRSAPRASTALPPSFVASGHRISLHTLADLDDLRSGAIEPGSVEEVGLAGTGLTSNDLAALRPLHSLRVLDLGKNGLEYIASGFLPNFPLLEVLNLAGNRLSEVPEDIGGLARLRRLGLKGNRLTCLPPSIGQLRALEELYLTDNALTALPPSIGGLESLVKLQASFNELTTLPLELADLRRLELLRVACCRLTHLPPALAGLPSLCWLSVAGNPLVPVPGSGQALPPTIPFAHLALGQKLGCGASGEVYRASWEGREVALKLFVGEVSPDGRAVDEESVACALADPCLVRVLARTAEPWGLVLDLVEGQPLAAKPDHTVRGPHSPARRWKRGVGPRRSQCPALPPRPRWFRGAYSRGQYPAQPPAAAQLLRTAPTPPPHTRPSPPRSPCCGAPGRRARGTAWRYCCASHTPWQPPSRTCTAAASRTATCTPTTSWQGRTARRSSVTTVRGLLPAA